MRLDKIYTKAGDRGKTSLILGRQVSKADLQIETFGLIDHVNANVGMLRTELDQNTNKDLRSLKVAIPRIQQILFDVGGYLSYPNGIIPEGVTLGEDEILDWLESTMDFMQVKLEPLKSFVLPGGNPLNAWLHLCRTTTRTAERSAVRLLDQDFSEAHITPAIQILNRLSDWFFIASRYASSCLDTPEYLWEKPLKNSAE